MSDVKLDIDDGIIALIKDNNYVVIELLFRLGQLTLDTFQKYIITEYEKKQNLYINPTLIFLLSDLLDNMLDKQIIDIFLNSIIIYSNVHSRETLSSKIERLINMGGEIQPRHLSRLPNNIFFEYVESNYVEMNDDLLYDYIINSSDEVTCWIIERWNPIETQIYALIRRAISFMKLNSMSSLIKKAYECFIGEKVIFYILYQRHFSFPYPLTEYTLSKEISFVIYANLDINQDTTNIYKCLHPEIIKYDISQIKKMYQLSNISHHDMRFDENNYYENAINIIADIVAIL